MCIQYHTSPEASACRPLSLMERCSMVLAATLPIARTVGSAFLCEMQLCSHCLLELSVVCPVSKPTASPPSAVPAVLWACHQTSLGTGLNWCSPPGQLEDCSHIFLTEQVQDVGA